MTCCSCEQHICGTVINIQTEDTYEDFCEDCGEEVLFDLIREKTDFIVRFEYSCADEWANYIDDMHDVDI